MSAISLPHHEHELRKSRPGRALARFLSPGPAFRLHASSAPQRAQVEQYIFDQFKAVHGAAIHEYMPLLLTMSCNHRFSAALGIRSAQGCSLFLEQYLSEPAETVLSRLSGRSADRTMVLEIGNMAATRRGASQLLFLIVTALLHASGKEWLVFCATPSVQKSIRRLGFKLYTLGDADPASLDDPACLSEWGSYYESRPQVMAGNLSEAMSVLSDRKIYRCLISHYQNRIDVLATKIKSEKSFNGMQSLAA